MLFELQYHKGTLIDVRHVGKDGMPCDPHGEPKPWGRLETSGDFRIERRNLLQEEGEKLRAGSMAHQDADRAVDLHDEDSLLNYIIHETNDDFRGRLKGLLQ